MSRPLTWLTDFLHPLVWVLLAMLGFWWLGASLAGDAQTAAQKPIRGEVSSSVEITVLDLPDGAVGVFQTQSNAPLARFESGEGSFVRTIFRSLVRDRRVRQVSAPPQFIIRGLSDGRVIVEDPSTGSHIDLDAFGHINAEQFRDMLQAGAASSKLGSSAGVVTR
ncbi:photosynthetic complex assembly protein PuhC [Luminiphilus sp.]|nr:photosynthetic complex assembly protein PuhC [Luminiphilus sp.]